MSRPLKLLLVEDSPNDAELVLSELRKGGFAPEYRRVQTEKDYLAHLNDDIELVISDYSLPEFSGLRAMRLLKESGVQVPFILVSGTIGEEAAVDALTLGAADYLLKDRLVRLGPAVTRTLEQYRLQKERGKSEEALRRAEENYRSIFDNSSEGIFQTDPEGRIIVANRAMAKIFGFGSPEEMLRERTDIVFKGYINLERRAEFDRLIDRDGAVASFEYETLRRDGRRIWISKNVRAVRDAQGRIQRFEGILEDFTQRRQMEEQFRQAQKMEAIGTLAGGIAHDFNNILTVICGYTELIRMAVGNDPELGSHADAVAAAAARATNLVRQILTFSRREETRRAVIDLETVTSEAMKFLRSTIPSTIEFDTSLPTGLPPVLADATQIHQIVMNLGTNAAHAMKDHPGKLTVKLENFTVDPWMAESNPSLRAGQYLRLTINDTGTGMDRDTLERMFEPFFTTKTPGEGTGLGLSVVHGIMKSHDGAIFVYSQPGEGTTFHLYFPVHLSEPAPKPEPAASVKAGHSERVLFVDDEEPLARVGHKALEKLGYAVESRTNVYEALALFREKPQDFDVIVTDLAMPGMAGTEFARQVLEIRPDMPIILATGYSASLTTERVRQMGIRELLIKPHSIQILGDAVSRALAETVSDGAA